MNSAILYKEWLKTRKVFAIVLLLTAALGIYAVLRMNRLIELKGVEHLWLIMILKDNTFIDVIKFSPPVAGAALGIAQMAPEMSQKRLKLTLHLPVSQMKLISLMLGTGLAELLTIFLIQSIMIVIYDLRIIPHELVWRVMLTAAPWYLAGMQAYLFTSAICLEGTVARRIIIGLMGICALLVCYVQPAMEAYNGGMLAGMCIFTLSLTILSLGSVIRFKEGYQS